MKHTLLTLPLEIRDQIRGHMGDYNSDLLCWFKFKITCRQAFHEASGKEEAKLLPRFFKLRTKHAYEDPAIWLFYVIKNQKDLKKFRELFLRLYHTDPEAISEEHLPYHPIFGSMYKEHLRVTQQKTLSPGKKVELLLKKADKNPAYSKFLLAMVHEKNVSLFDQQSVKTNPLVGYYVVNIILNTPEILNFALYYESKILTILEMQDRLRSCVLEAVQKVTPNEKFLDDFKTFVEDYHRSHYLRPYSMRVDDDFLFRELDWAIIHLTASCAASRKDLQNKKNEALLIEEMRNFVGQQTASSGASIDFPMYRPV